MKKNKKKLISALTKFNSEGGFGGIVNWGNPFTDVNEELNTAFKKVIAEIRDFEDVWEQVLEDNNIEPDDIEY